MFFLLTTFNPFKIFANYASVTFFREYRKAYLMFLCNVYLMDKLAFLLHLASNTTCLCKICLPPCVFIMNILIMLLWAIQIFKYIMGTLMRLTKILSMFLSKSVNNDKWWNILSFSNHVVWSLLLFPPVKTI